MTAKEDLWGNGDVPLVNRDVLRAFRGFLTGALSYEQYRALAEQAIREAEPGEGDSSE